MSVPRGPVTVTVRALVEIWTLLGTSSVSSLKISRMVGLASVSAELGGREGKQATPPWLLAGCSRAAASRQQGGSRAAKAPAMRESKSGGVERASEQTIAAKDTRELVLAAEPPSGAASASQTNSART